MEFQIFTKKFLMERPIPTKKFPIALKAVIKAFFMVSHIPTKKLPTAFAPAISAFLIVSQFFTISMIPAIIAAGIGNKIARIAAPNFLKNSHTAFMPLISAALTTSHFFTSRVITPIKPTTAIIISPIGFAAITALRTVCTAVHILIADTIPRIMYAIGFSAGPRVSIPAAKTDSTAPTIFPRVSKTGVSALTATARPDVSFSTSSSNTPMALKTLSQRTFKAFTTGITNACIGSNAAFKAFARLPIIGRSFSKIFPTLSPRYLKAGVSASITGRSCSIISAAKLNTSLKIGFRDSRTGFTKASIGLNASKIALAIAKIKGRLL